MATLAAILDGLEAFYGRPPRPALRDPYLLILHRLSGYPQSDTHRDRGYAALRAEFGTEAPRAGIVQGQPAALRRLPILRVPSRPARFH